jgi:6-phosphogluconolactonase
MFRLEVPGKRPHAMNDTIQVFPTADALAHGAAEKIVSVMGSALLESGPASFVFSGGNTPQSVYELLASDRYAKRVDWSRVHFFWGDERCVPPTHPDSNYHMVQQAFLRHLPIAPQHVHRIRGEVHPADAAGIYETELFTALGSARPAVPRLTMVLLGLGIDGHTASLFPGTPVLHEKDRLIAEVFVERMGAWRITMTYPLLNNARTVLFLVSGQNKAAILNTVHTDPGAQLPACRIAPHSGELLWYADRDAASHLSTTELP